MTQIGLDTVSRQADALAHPLQFLLLPHDGSINSWTVYWDSDRDSDKDVNRQVSAWKLQVKTWMKVLFMSK